MRVHGRGGGGSATPTGWPLPGYTTDFSLSVLYTATANRLTLFARFLPSSVLFSKLVFYVQTQDGGNNSDFGVYNASGTLIANIGAQILGAQGLQTIASVQGALTIQAGLYYYGFTSAAANLQLYGNNGGITPYYNASYAASVGGALPASITPPTLAAAREMVCFALL